MSENTMVHRVELSIKSFAEERIETSIACHRENYFK